MKSQAYSVANSLLFALALLATTGSGRAGDIEALKANDDKEFKAGNGKTLLYALAEPANPEPDKRYPLVVFLHGAGGMGGERKWDRGKDGGWTFFQTIGEPCYFFMPQATEPWAGIGWGAVPYKMNENPTKTMEALIECIEWMIMNKAVDTDRVYVAGASMGSMGMWDLVCRRPDLFAAGISVCGGFDAGQAEKIAKISFRIFHGDQDPWVPIAGSQVMFDALKEAGADVDFHIYEGAHHFIWDQTYGNQKNIHWLFEQRRIHPRDAMHTWTSTAGRQLNAKFVRCEVVLMTEDGTERRIDLESFSEQDRSHIKSLMK